MGGYLCWMSITNLGVAELDLSIQWEFKSNFSKPKGLKRLAALEIMNLLGEEDEKVSFLGSLERMSNFI